MNKKELDAVLKKHALWLNNDPKGERADLQDAYLRGADLRGAYLQRADLQDADLQDAYLRGADLRGADLQRADLQDADLQGADLRGAYLRGADLRGAYLQRADLQDADLQDAYLRGADLRVPTCSVPTCRMPTCRVPTCGVPTCGVPTCSVPTCRMPTCGVPTCGVPKNISELVVAQTSIIPEGEVIGWKKLRDERIAKLLIPADARRSNATGRKCRAEFVSVLEITKGNKKYNKGVSKYTDAFIYKVGEIVKCDTWNEDRWIECGGGIHFFITKTEAENY